MSSKASFRYFSCTRFDPMALNVKSVGTNTTTNAIAANRAPTRTSGDLNALSSSSSSFVENDSSPPNVGASGDIGVIVGVPPNAAGDDVDVDDPPVPPVIFALVSPSSRTRFNFASKLFSSKIDDDDDELELELELLAPSSVVVDDSRRAAASARSNVAIFASSRSMNSVFNRFSDFFFNDAFVFFRCPPPSPPPPLPRAAFA